MDAIAISPFSYQNGYTSGRLTWTVKLHLTLSSWLLIIDERLSFIERRNQRELRRRIVAALDYLKRRAER